MYIYVLNISIIIWQANILVLNSCIEVELEEM